jgi:hypothetical protein
MKFGMLLLLLAFPMRMGLGQVYFSDNFESGLANWSTSGQDWAMTATTARAGLYSITDSPSGSYPSNANAIFGTAQALNLTGTNYPVLGFWSKFSLSNNSGYNCYNVDSGLVEVSTDGGFNWKLLKAFTGYLNTWNYFEIDLRNYKVSSAKFRFRLHSGGSCEDDGWFIDDVEIKEYSTGPLLTLPLTEGFEGSLTQWVRSGQDWNIFAAKFRAGGHCMTDSPSGLYPSYGNSFLSLAGMLDLTATTFPVLTFWHRYAINNNSGYNCYNIDSASVEISTDAGVTWKRVTSFTGYLYSWEQVLVDLRPYKQDSVKLRFRMDSKGSCEDDGWFVDDIYIGEFSRPRIHGSQFTETFESGLRHWIVSTQEWDTTSTTYRSPAHCMTDSKVGNYPSYARSIATMDSMLDLRGATFPLMSFWHKYSLNNNSGYNCYNIDSACVDVSTDGGWTWMLDTSFTGTLSTWNEVLVDLRPYLRDSVMFRFRLGSGGSCEDDGWYIDDVSITGLLSVCDNDGNLPSSFTLFQNFPNPFNPTTVIRYQLPLACDVKLAVYDLLGREMTVLVNEKKEAGRYEVKFNGSGLSSGLYFYRMHAGPHNEAKKLVLLR